MADNTAPKQRGRPFKPGQSGNPNGRPKGSRNKFGEAFLAALQADFDEFGEDVIQVVRREKPDVYMRVCAKLLPQQLEVETKSDVELMTDEQLDNMIAHLTSKLESQGSTR